MSKDRGGAEYHTVVRDAKPDLFAVRPVDPLQLATVQVLHRLSPSRQVRKALGLSGRQYRKHVKQQRRA